MDTIKILEEFKRGEITILTAQKKLKSEFTNDIVGLNKTHNIPRGHFTCKDCGDLVAAKQLNHVNQITNSSVQMLCWMCLEDYD